MKELKELKELNQQKVVRPLRTKERQNLRVKI
jgi:hypothetical protein